jgi:hypothetical protein
MFGSCEVCYLFSAYYSCLACCSARRHAHRKSSSHFQYLFDNTTEVGKKKHAFDVMSKQWVEVPTVEVIGLVQNQDTNFITI